MISATLRRERTDSIGPTLVYWFFPAAVPPDLDPAHFVFEEWAINTIKADRQAWENFLSFPENYRRIKLDRIQHYRNTARPGQAEAALKNFVRDCHNGKMSPNLSDFGRLENC